MPKCNDCNKTIPNGSKFCNFCGKKQEVLKKKNKYYVRPDGLHECIKTIDGKRIPFRGRTDAEVDQKMLAWRGRIENGRLFKDVADEWRAEHEATLGPNTWRAYDKPFNRSKERFGETYIRQIEPADIEDYLHSLAIIPLGKATVSQHRLVVNMICSHAIRKKDVETNPCEYARIPSICKPKKKRMPPTEDEFEKIKKSLDVNDPYSLLEYTCLYTGLRRGECIALQHGDIDYKTKQIHIERSMYHKNSDVKYKPPKSDAGTRYVPLLDKLAEVLPKGDPEAFIFPQEKKTTLEKHLRKYRKKVGITCTLHQLRHGYATMLYEAKIDEKLAASYMGHADEKMLHEVYAHLRQKEKNSGASRLNRFVNKEESKRKKAAQNTGSTQQDV